MELTQEQLKVLLDYKNVLDDDNLRYKEIIKKELINDNLLLYLLNDDEVEDPDEFLDYHIKPFYLIYDTQHNVHNFICFETSFREQMKYNEIIKYQQIYFYVLCEQKNNIEKKTGLARHDLIAARIRDIFNWTNKFGTQCHIISDMPRVVDNFYNCRTLIFELNAPNNLAKTRNNVTRVVNYQVNG